MARMLPETTSIGNLLRHGSPLRTSSTVELSNDIWLSVLDYITVSSDLRSLCLTSRTLRTLATPRLYDTVRIRLWEKRQIEAVFRSFGSGAGVRFIDTRTIVFEDEPPPSKQMCISAGSMAFQRPEDRSQTLGIDVDRTLQHILHMLPSEKLLAYRFVSCRALPDTAAELLTTFANISHVQSTVSEEMHPFLSCFTEYSNLRSLDLQIMEPRSLEYIARALHKVGGTLERLCLGQVHPKLGRREFSDALRRGLQTSGSRAQSTTILPRVRELTLLGFDLSALFQPISTLVNLAALLRVTIFQCHGIPELLSNVEKQIGGKAFALEHFTIQSPEESEVDSNDDVLVAAKNCLQAMLQSVTLLSLHTSWDNRSVLKDTFAEVCPKSQKILSLSMHDLYDSSDEYDTDGEVNLHYLRETFQACSKLRAFGYKIPEVFVIEEDSEGYARMDDGFMKALQCAPELRILHLRQRNVVNPELYSTMEYNQRSREALTFLIHRWANAFFEYMHTRKWSTRLKALVVRCYVEEDEHEEDVNRAYNPQHCFVKGLQTDMLGRSAAVAVPVSRAQLREAEPYADILDFDPQSRCIGGRVGRFNDF